MKRLIAYVNRLIYSRHMLWGVGLASFLESLIVPIPLETILIPLMQARRDKLWLISGVALLGCLLGATLGYGVGFFIFDLIGQHLINWFSTPAQFAEIQATMHKQGFWFVLSIGVVPIPFQIAMLAAGVTGFSIFLYLLATFISRGIRYFGLGLLVYLFGNQTQQLFERNKTKAFLLLLLLVIVIWLLTSFIR